MPHLIKLYPNSNPSICDLPGLRPQRISEQAQEVWVDLRVIYSVNFEHEIWRNCNQIIVYDWFHAADCITPGLVQRVQALGQIAPVCWVSTHILNIPDICHQRWDYLWNRCRRAYLEHLPSWKQGPFPENYQQYPMSWDPRPCRYLQLFNRPTPFRTRLSEMVRKYSGYWSDFHGGIILPPNQGHATDWYSALPRRDILDSSYISCQVESTSESGYGICFTEKTYDHLIQCRMVLNFGPAGFYRALENDGWQLYREIDLTWDQIVNNELRFQAYLNCLENLFRLSDLDMHDLFLLNKNVIIHNYNRLKEKPYDYFNGIGSS